MTNYNNSVASLAQQIQSAWDAKAAAAAARASADRNARLAAEERAKDRTLEAERYNSGLAKEASAQYRGLATELQTRLDAIAADTTLKDTAKATKYGALASEYNKAMTAYGQPKAFDSLVDQYLTALPRESLKYNTKAAENRATGIYYDKQNGLYFGPKR
jgi:hypothetical protein